ncbi:MAG: hypothetical protein RLZZ313_1761 [Verrucomicrobiota bacterium]
MTSELASPQTISRLEKLYRSARVKYFAEVDLVVQAGGDPEEAALSVVASSLLNCDEALTK